MTEPENKVKNWPGEHVLALDFRSLAAFRILFSAVLLLDCLIRWIDATAHYSDLGLLPRGVLLEQGWTPSFFSLHMINGQPAFIHAMFAIQALAALALLCGFRTRSATLLSWLLLVSIHNRNPWVLNGGDVYARVILFWMLFLPWGQIWSMDAQRKQSDFRWWMGKLSEDGRGVRSMASLAVLLQISLLYWFAALPKTHPSWVADNSAINIALHLDYLVKPFGVAFREMFADQLPALTWLVFLWEFWGPFLLWFPFDKGQVRTFSLCLFAAMHMGFELCFAIGLFPAYCMVILSVLLPGWFWEKLGFVKSYDISLPKISRRRHQAAQWSCGLLVLYLVAWNFSNEQFRPVISIPDPLKWVAFTLRLDQRWNMFSPSPPYHDGWWVAVAHRRSGDTLNLFDPTGPITWDKPENISGGYLTQRRRRWWMELRSTNNQRLLSSTCTYLCNKLNGDKRSLHEVKEVELYYMLELTRMDGSEMEPRKVEVYRHDNFPPNPSVPVNVIVPEEENVGE